METKKQQKTHQLVHRGALTDTHLEDLTKSIKRKLAANWENEWNNIAPPYVKNLIDNPSQISTEPTTSQNR